MNFEITTDHSRPAWLFAVVLVSAIITSGCQSAAVTASGTPKVVFIIVDGITADVLENVATPNLDEISAVGGYTRAYVGGAIGEESESPTISAVGYNNLLTGTWSNKHNVWGNEIKEPNYEYWDIFRIAKAHDSSLHTSIFSTWEDNRTKLLGDGLPAAGGEKLDYHFDGFENDTERFPHDAAGNYIKDIDNLVAGEAARYISERGPDLSWVYLEYSDSIAHTYGDSSEYNDAVQQMDEWVGLVWNAIKLRDRDEDWLIIVTTDHGRDKETGRHHGGQSERERTIWIATNSDRLNAHFNDAPEIVDILPSIAAHLRLDIPQSVREQLDGQSFID